MLRLAACDVVDDTAHPVRHQQFLDETQQDSTQTVGHESRDPPVVGLKDELVGALDGTRRQQRKEGGESGEFRRLDVQAG